jgi:GT2 family glycosyltransferase
MARVSVVIPAYQARRTLPCCLDHLKAQTFTDFQTIVVDSGAEPSLNPPAFQGLPQASILRSAARLLPHTASNRALSAATGDLLVFLDADAYPRREWLARLVEGWTVNGGVVAGAVACHGDRWLDQAAHLCKFDKWLPGDGTRRLTDAPSVSLLVSRQDFGRLGGFVEGTMHADTDLSWRLHDAGIPITLIADAIVEHHHLHSLGSLLSERYLRGRGYGLLWVSRFRPTRTHLAWRVFISLLPLRLASQTRRVWRQARLSETISTTRLVGVMPVVCLALYAWLLGESRSLLSAAGRGV